MYMNFINNNIEDIECNVNKINVSMPPVPSIDNEIHYQLINADIS